MLCCTHLGLADVSCGCDHEGNQLGGGLLLHLEVCRAILLAFVSHSGAFSEGHIEYINHLFSEMAGQMVKSFRLFFLLNPDERA